MRVAGTGMCYSNDYLNDFLVRGERAFHRRAPPKALDRPIYPTFSSSFGKVKDDGNHACRCPNDHA